MSLWSKTAFMVVAKLTEKLHILFCQLSANTQETTRHMVKNEFRYVLWENLA
jgi:hypothetical protein